MGRGGRPQKALGGDGNVDARLVVEGNVHHVRVEFLQECRLAAALGTHGDEDGGGVRQGILRIPGSLQGMLRWLGTPILVVVMLVPVIVAGRSPVSLPQGRLSTVEIHAETLDQQELGMIRKEGGDWNQKEDRRRARINLGARAQS